MGKLFLFFLFLMLFGKALKRGVIFFVSQKAVGEDEIPCGDFSVMEYIGRRNGQYLYQIEFESGKRLFVRLDKKLHK